MRLKKIVKSVKDSGIDPFKEGRRNFLKPKEETEKLAQQRIETCKGCENFQDETVDWLKVTDKRIPEATDKYCDDCGCIISFLIRQNSKPCEKWQEK